MKLYRIIILFLLILLSISGCNKKPDRIGIDLNREMYVIAKTGITLRKEPSVFSEEYVHLPYKSKVTALNKTLKTEIANENTDFWYYIECSSKSGWAFGSDLSEYDPDVFIIKKDGIGPGRLGMSFDEFLSHFKYDKIEKNKYGVALIYRDNKLILSLSDKDYGKSQIVKWIIISDTKFQTENGIHTGLSIKELNEIYPEFKINIYRKNRVSFTPLDFQTVTQDNKKYVIFLLDFQTDDLSKTDKKKIVSNKSDYKTGRISKINIYYYN